MAIKHQIGGTSDKPRPLGRRSFLRKAGGTLALGAGLTMLPAQAALADQAARTQTGQGKRATPLACASCCRSSCANCPPGYNAYTCNNHCGGPTSCCNCLAATTTCIDLGVAPC